MSVKIDFSKDSLLDEFAKATLKDRYMIPGEESPQEAGARAQALRLSNAERDWLMTVIGAIRVPLQEDDWSPLVLHRFWRQTGSAGVDVCLLAAATYLGRAGSALAGNEDVPPPHGKGRAGSAGAASLLSSTRPERA